MTDLFLALIETLEKETGHYKRLIALAEGQKEILVSGKMEPLNTNIRLQEKEVFALGPVTAKRTELLSKIGSGLGRKKMDLKQALQASPADSLASLKEAVGRLVETVKRLDDVNKTNGKLLNNAVSFASFTLRLIQGNGKKSTLSSTGDRESDKSSFVNRVV